MRRAYLDYASTTPVDGRVVEAMLPYFTEKYGNPTSFYSVGQEAKAAVEEARAKVAELINAQPQEIIFTSGGTEACNLAVKGFALKNKGKGKHLVVSKIEHFAVLEACRWLAQRGFEISYLDVDEYGIVKPETLEEAIKRDTILAIVNHANNEIGTIEPIKELAEVAQDRGVALFSDACISNGIVEIDVEELGVDMLAMSAHKMYGPKGVGALYVARGVRLEALMHGGGQERKLRSGTENVPGIVGFGRAAEIAKQEMRSEAKRLVKLRDDIIREVLKIERTRLNGHPTQRLPNNANFGFAFIEGEGLILELDFAGISASTGSACSSPTLEPSHVLTAIGLSHAEAHGSLRITLGRFTTPEDVQQLLDVLPGVVKRLRDISPFKGSFEDYVEGTEWKGGEHKHV
ncbi:cysteine desulfurase family protein [Candidatus Pyrohabitans sp.]